MAVAKEQIRQIISENNISSVADVYTLLKDSFKDILQELMEAELDATLGYEKNHKGDLQTDNKRNGHSTKNLKSQYGEFQIDVPRDRNGEFEPKLIPKCQRERNQKVDAEIPELGSGIESADSPLRRTAYCLSVREKKSRNGEALLSPSFLLSVYSFGIYIIARNFRSYSRGRVWAEPTKGNDHDALLVMQKNRK